jgi:hypothetical protein
VPGNGFLEGENQIVIAVDEHQFQIRYAPIACGLQVLVVGCGFITVIATIWWLVTRGG